MQIEQIKGLVFSSPEDGTTYGRIRATDTPPDLYPFTKTGCRAFAEDDCGNAFVFSPDGTILFWDHETDELITLAKDWSDFLLNCKPPTEVEFDPSRVISAWIDPEFKKQIQSNDPKKDQRQ